ncbi:DUF1864 family protein [Leuconostoc citreum]|uniref:DUF1864 family protein n=1 Tax=Leuconostoc citreum TaxID=33964 RepID=UPI00200A2F5F|nr:DUF1864 family protein [Leuconostoc citreum]MCK8605683.1 DUF1864 family protein [Leuconostoc citreum]
MAKKTITEQIQEANHQLEALDAQARAIQEDKKKVRLELKKLNDQLVNELGRQLLNKLALQDSNPDDIQTAFEQLDDINFNQGEVRHEAN